MCSPSVPNDQEFGPADSQRFPKFRRLRKRAEFQRVYEQGRRIRSSLFTAFVRAGDEAKPGRVGLTVSKAIGKATVRNAVKRSLREAVRRHWSDLPDGYEVVLHARRQIVDAAWPSIETEVERTFQTARNARRTQHTGQRTKTVRNS